MTFIMLTIYKYRIASTNAKILGIRLCSNIGKPTVLNPLCGEVPLLSCNAGAWWRHQMETFSALLAICAGNSPVPGEFPTQRPVTRTFDVFFDLRLNKRLSKQSWGWWFETLSPPLWRHCNGQSNWSNHSHKNVLLRLIVWCNLAALMHTRLSYLRETDNKV